MSHPRAAVRRIALVALLSLATACARQELAPDTDAKAVVDEVTALVNEMAANASARDVRSNLRFIPGTDRVVYVSDGAPITGAEYAKELGESYASREQMSFQWERLEVTPLGSAAAAVTGWALTSVTPAGGQPVRQRYIFTMVFARDGSGWRRVLAQKARLSE